MERWRGDAFLKLHCIMGSGDKKRIRGAYVTLLSDATAFNHTDLSFHMSKTTAKMSRFWWWNADTFIVCCWGFWTKIISIRWGFASAQRCIFTLVGFPALMHTPCIQINNQQKGGEEKGEEAKREEGGKRQGQKRWDKTRSLWWSNRQLYSHLSTHTWIFHVQRRGKKSWITFWSSSA